MAAERLRRGGRPGSRLPHHGEDAGSADGQRGGGPDARGAATAYDAGPAVDRGDPGGGGITRDVVRVLVERGAQVVERVHRVSSPVSSVRSSSDGSIRSEASALLVWLLTVPTAMPSRSAVCASVRSSK